METLVGKIAPDFEAMAYINGEIRTLKLSAFRDKWVLLVFYPGDFTFVCPTELASIARRYDEFKEMNVEVIGISIDTPYVHKAWQEAELGKMLGKDIPYALAHDLRGEIGELFGIYDREKGVDLRGTVLIDPDGIIQFIDILNDAVGRNTEELIRRIQACQYVKGLGGKEVCIADWTPGKKTMKPDVKLAGKIHEAV